MGWNGSNKSKLNFLIIFSDDDWFVVDFWRANFYFFEFWYLVKSRRAHDCTSFGILNYFIIYFCCFMLSTANFLHRLAIFGRTRLAYVWPRIVINWGRLLIDTLLNSYLCKFGYCLMRMFVIYFFTFVNWGSVEYVLIRKPAAYMKVDKEFLCCH